MAQVVGVGTTAGSNEPRMISTRSKGRELRMLEPVLPPK